MVLIVGPPTPTRFFDVGIYKQASRGRCDQQHSLAFEEADFAGPPHGCARKNGDSGGKLVAMYGSMTDGPGAMAIFDADPAGHQWVPIV